MAHLLVALRWFIGAVFLIAMLMKVRRAAWSDFIATVRAIIGGAAIPATPVAVGMTVAEAACPLLLATYPVSGFALALTLLAVMTGAIVATIRRRAEISCPCFGASTTRLGIRHVVRNSILAAAALAGLFGATSYSPPLPTSGVVIAAVAGMLAAAVVAMLDDIIDLFTDETSAITANRSSA
ncbi:MAG TPA: hypothetical protein DGG94_07375 [Micromonosporaceae bacterium]|nr:hypothetical protein [Micromonosporaceae bacterium]HCU49606.1 hypothetical protein [Micromonosporaceae bacterium]